MAIAVGTPAPDFTLKDQSQKEVKLSDFKGKKSVVVAFYPLDWSPVCSNEHACFVDDMKRFEQLDAQVLGVSVDSAWSHKAFAEKMHINYPLLADFQPRGAVADKFGVYRGALDEKAVRDAIELSEAKYCSVAAMLRKAAPISFRHEILPTGS